MPELPEVETTKTSLTPLIGQTVISVAIYQPKLREMMPSDLSTLVGFCLHQVTRRAKYLLLDFYHQIDNRHKVLLVHLGMSGSLQQHNHKGAPTIRKHDHLIVGFVDKNGNQTVLHYHDPRRFGIIVWARNDDYLCPDETLANKYLAHLGVEPLEADFDGDYLYHFIHKNKKPLKKPIKSVIMEQSIVVGVGNIYVTESLFLAGIHPATPAYLLDKACIDRLVTHIKAILQKSITQGGSSLKDFQVGAGKTGYFQQTLLVYGRENQPCTVCHTPLQNLKISGRASVYCPYCQPYLT